MTLNPLNLVGAQVGHLELIKFSSVMLVTVALNQILWY